MTDRVNRSELIVAAYDPLERRCRSPQSSCSQTELQFALRQGIAGSNGSSAWSIAAASSFVGDRCNQQLSVIRSRLAHDEVRSRTRTQLAPSKWCSHWSLQHQKLARGESPGIFLVGEDGGTLKRRPQQLSIRRQLFHLCFQGFTRGDRLRQATADAVKFPLETHTLSARRERRREGPSRPPARLRRSASSQRGHRRVRSHERRLRPG